MRAEQRSLSQPKTTPRSEGSMSLRHRLLQLLRLSDSSFSKQWANQRTAINHYWKVYGGFRALFLSPYLHISLLLTFVCWVFWTNPKVSAADIAVGVLPNLLGFTVGALAIVLAFSSAEVFEIIAEKGEPRSFFMKLTASLIHFILVQVLALTSAIAAKITETPSLDVLALFLLFYAVLVTFAAGLQLFLTAIIYNAKASIHAEEEPHKPDGQH